jgi:hypothetical protein
MLLLGNDSLVISLNFLLIGKGAINHGNLNKISIIIDRQREVPDMVFRAKIDSFFLSVMSVTIFVVSGVLLIPFFLDHNRTMLDAAVVFSLLILSVGFIVWSVCSLTYVFCDGYLLVKGGPFRSRILYQEITKVSPTNDIFTGYRLLSAKSGIEIFYQSGFLGSVKISPKEMDLFLSELKKRCPHVIIQGRQP